MCALLALYQALRIAVTFAVTTVPCTYPDRASYQIAVQTAQILVTCARYVSTGVSYLSGFSATPFSLPALSSPPSLPLVKSPLSLL